MFSRKCALDVTPLDEKPFLYEEELILGISMEKAGWKTVYDPKSVVHHLHGNSTEKVKAFAYTCNICSEIYFCRELMNNINECKFAYEEEQKRITNGILNVKGAQNGNFRKSG